MLGALFSCPHLVVQLVVHTWWYVFFCVLPPNTERWGLRCLLLDEGLIKNGRWGCAVLRILPRFGSGSLGSLLCGAEFKHRGGVVLEQRFVLVALHGVCVRRHCWIEELSLTFAGRFFYFLESLPFPFWSIGELLCCLYLYTYVNS